MTPPNSIASSPTTAQSLGALLKSARDIMRKDKGLNGDPDRRSNSRLLRGSGFRGDDDRWQGVIDIRCKRNRIVPLRKLDIPSFLYLPESFL